MIEIVAGKFAEVLSGVLLTETGKHIYTERKSFGAALSHSTVYRSRRLRVSVAQLLSIKVDDRYVLISNVKRPERVTPIGGAIRYFPSARPMLEGEVRFKPELTKGDERYDLRGYILGREFVPFLRWYATGENREHFGLAREIEEEFTEIGAPQITRYLRRPEFVKERTVHEGPESVGNRDYWQYRLFEIYRLQEESAPTKILADFIRSTAVKNSNCVLVTTDDIRRGRLEGGKLIGDSAGYLYSEVAEGEKPSLPGREP